MRIIALIFAIVAGLVILLGYFVPAFAGLRNLLLNSAVILAGTAAIVGVFNLILVHATRIQKREKGAAYSGILLIALFAAFVFGLVLGPDHPDMRRLLNAVVVPAESSLMALLAASLIYGGVRLLRRRINLMTIVFLATAALMLVASATMPYIATGLLHDYVKPWFYHVLALGGARGLLIGVALGTLVTGLRVLLGSDRPYEGG